MIHAKDLMVGDWVKFPIGNDKVVDLPYIEGRGICASFAASATLFPVEIDKIEPIPLTPEILEKNGFYKDELTRRTSQWMLNDDYYDVIVYEVSDSIWCIEYDNTEAHLPTCRNLVCFVHELQHCLKLVGIDKEVEL